MRARLCVLPLVLALSGCGGPNQMIRTAPPPNHLRADGRLAVQPVPLTLADLSRAAPGTPRRRILRLVFDTQWGDLDGVTAAYDPTVAALLSPQRIRSAESWLRSQMLAARARIIAVQPAGPGRQFVVVDFDSLYSPPAREFFLMRRRVNGWKIVSDTLLARALVGREFQLLNRRRRFANGRPPPALVLRAQRAAQSYRQTKDSRRLIVLINIRSRLLPARAGPP